MNRSAKLYADSPRLKRDEESGSMKESRPSEDMPGGNPADNENAGVAGNPIPGTPGEMPIEASQSHERHEMHHKHMTEHMQIHRRHELEHATHKGDKAPLHRVHEKEQKEMHDRHQAEMKIVHKKHESMVADKMEKPDTAPKSDGSHYHQEKE